MSSEIIVVYSFTDNYAKMASVSMTSLLYNTKRDCHIHVFENSVSKESLDKILSIQDKYDNARISVHHIDDEVFSEHSGDPWGKELWYPLLAPEILSDLNKALVLEPDTLVCRDVAELYDIQLGDKYAAVLTLAPMIELYESDCWRYWWGVDSKVAKISASVMLLNLKGIRDNDIFNRQRMNELVNLLKPKVSYWAAIETYLSYIFDAEHIIKLPHKYNSYNAWNLYTPEYDMLLEFDEVYEAVNDPVVAHFMVYKPENMSLQTGNYSKRFQKWWEFLSLSPFSDPANDAEKKKAAISRRDNDRDMPMSISDYRYNRMIFDLMEGCERLKELSSSVKIIIYGAGVMGCKFSRLARLMDVKIEFLCDIVKSGNTIDGVLVRHPDILPKYRSNAIVVIAIEEPNAWSDVAAKLTNMGFPCKHIFPVFEQMAVNGRKWSELLGAISI